MWSKCFHFCLFLLRCPWKHWMLFMNTVSPLCFIMDRSSSKICRSSLVQKKSHNDNFIALRIPKWVPQSSLKHCIIELPTFAPTTWKTRPDARARTGLERLSFLHRLLLWTCLSRIYAVVCAPRNNTQTKCGVHWWRTYEQIGVWISTDSKRTIQDDHHHHRRRIYIYDDTLKGRALSPTSSKKKRDERIQ